MLMASLWSVRYIVGDDTTPEQTQITLVWRGTVMADETASQ